MYLYSAAVTPPLMLVTAAEAIAAAEINYGRSTTTVAAALNFVSNNPANTNPSMSPTRIGSATVLSGDDQHDRNTEFEYCFASLLLLFWIIIVSFIPVGDRVGSVVIVIAILKRSGQQAPIDEGDSRVGATHRHEKGSDNTSI